MPIVGTFQVLKLLFVRKYKRYHFFYFWLIYASIFTVAEIIFYNFIEPFLIVQANYELNWKLYCYRDIPEKIQTGFQKYWRKSMWEFLGLVKKEVEFPGVLMKNSCVEFPWVLKNTLMDTFYGWTTKPLLHTRRQFTFYC